MDWTNTQRQAKDIDDLASMNKWIEENPNLSHAAAAGAGLADFMTYGGILDPNKEWRSLRGSHPFTYRAGQAALPAFMTTVDRGIPPPVIWPNIMAAVLNEPYVQRLYNDKLRPYLEKESIFSNAAPEEPASDKRMSDLLKSLP